MQTQGMPSLENIMRTAKQRSDDRRWNERVKELAGLIDDLAAERGSIALVEAIRHHGYNIEADCGALERRGLTIN